MSIGPETTPEKLPGKDLPRYAAVRAMLQEKIISGEYALGQQIPTELALCKHYNLSRKTVHRAINELVADGFLFRRRGSGTFVKFKRSTEQKNLIGVLTSLNTIGYGAYDQIIESIQTEAKKQGYEILLYNNRQDSKTAYEQAAQLNKQKAIGSLFFPIQHTPNPNNLQIIQMLRNTGQHVVVLDMLLDDCDDPDVSFVTAQNDEGVYQLTKHLIEKGYKRIAFLTGDSTVYTINQREQGFRRGMSEAGLPIPNEYFLMTAPREVSSQGIQEIQVLLAMRQPPEVIICLHDMIALNILNYCQENNIDVPNTIAIAGFDDLEPAAKSTPSLTTVHQPLNEIGRTAFNLLIDKLNITGDDQRHIELPCDLIVRDSC
ncbi:Arabinose metabolism transcriptional repressor [Poriferisphaera corsica]|uniref:Arabinose metabolism transcriptional repressor n=1 Tax=Poriferisphaera corsica TaxID=2528020 RepID=A0A517YYH3_9BACT|nr:GntR family transcriptional regulator [Poriferisphaera corsica]QDU35261.1 Arabinose metabolism transcriptional repressor [Poriferisphaera corsica]